MDDLGKVQHLLAGDEDGSEPRLGGIALAEVVAGPQNRGCGPCVACDPRRMRAQLMTGSRIAIDLDIMSGCPACVAPGSRSRQS